jgi:translation initiation factor 5B
LAILVIDITQGVQPQTKESIEILRQFKVPFVIAANKVDLIHGWKPKTPYLS